MTRIKNISTRIQLKNDTENNWNKAKAEEGKDGFIPLLGEAIVYMGENGHGPRIKIGDGETNVTELPFLEDNDTVYTASNGIQITAGNIIQHINNLDAFPSEIGFYKIKYDQQGHINGATAVSKQDILNLLQMTPGRIDSVQITAEAPLVSSNSTENTTNLVTNISFSSQGKNTVLAGPAQSATGAPSFRLLIQDDIPNLSASKITEGQISVERIANLPTSKITSGVFDVNRIPNLGVNKITGVIPVSQGGTGVDGVNGNLENNIPSFFNNGVFAYDAINTRFKQFGITVLGNTDTFASYVDSLNGATENLLIDLDTLIRAVPPMNLVNPATKYDENQEIKQSYRLSYYSPTTKGIKNSVLISDGDSDSNEDGLEPIWLDPTILSTEQQPGGALFYGRYSREIEQTTDGETITYTETGFETQWGTLPVEQGGTGNTTFSVGQVLIGSGKNSITTIEKTDLATSNTIVQRNANGDFATHSITLTKSLLGESFNANFPNRNIIDIDNNNIATFFGILNANNLKATIGEIEMSCSLSSDNTKQSKIKWYNPGSTTQLMGELYWDNISKRGILKNYYLSENLVLQSDAYYLPEVNTSSTTNNNFTFLATEDTVSNMFPANSVLYSNGKINKITYKNSANGALYSTSANGSLEWGTLPVAQGGTEATTPAGARANLDVPSITGSGASGTWRIDISGNATTATKATQDADGNTISSTYLKLSGGTLTGDLNFKTSSADSPDIIWWYGNTNNEQARIWMGNGFSSKAAPNFREYSSDGTSLYNGYLPLGDGTGASGTWGIDISGNAATATMPLGFASRTTGATWGSTIGTSFTSWNDSTGGSIDFRSDNPSSGKMSIKVDGRFYGNEGTNPAMLMDYTNSYWGMGTADGATNDWIRTTTAGIIPYESGGAGSGHCSLGTIYWYFSSAYIDNIYGSLNGNATSATYVKDRTNNTATYLNYGASGLSSDNITWLACWNGYELRTISKGQMLMRYAWWNVGDSHNANDLHGGITFAYPGHSNTATVGTLVDFSCGGDDHYPLQIQGCYSTNELFYRNRNGDQGAWNQWLRVVTGISVIPNVGASTVTPNYYNGGETFFKAAISYIARTYRYEGNLMGLLAPNSQGPFIGNIYSFTDVNSSGLPRYSTFIYHNLGSGLESFGTVDYNFYYRCYLHNGNYTDYTVTKTGSGASGTWPINITGSAGSIPTGALINLLKGTSFALLGTWTSSNGAGSSFSFDSNTIAIRLRIFASGWEYRGNTQEVFRSSSNSDSVNISAYDSSGALARVGVNINWVTNTVTLQDPSLPANLNIAIFKRY